MSFEERCWWIDHADRSRSRSSDSPFISTAAASMRISVRRPCLSQRMFRFPDDGRSREGVTFRFASTNLRSGGIWRQHSSACHRELQFRMHRQGKTHHANNAEIRDPEVRVMRFSVRNRSAHCRHETETASGVANSRRYSDADDHDRTGRRFFGIEGSRSCSSDAFDPHKVRRFEQKRRMPPQFLRQPTATLDYFASSLDEFHAVAEFGAVRGSALFHIGDFLLMQFFSRTVEGWTWFSKTKSAFSSSPQDLISHISASWRRW